MGFNFLSFGSRETGEAVVRNCVPDGLHRFCATLRDLILSPTNPLRSLSPLSPSQLFHANSERLTNEMSLPETSAPGTLKAVLAQPWSVSASVKLHLYIYIM